MVECEIEMPEWLSHPEFGFFKLDAGIQLSYENQIGNNLKESEYRVEGPISIKCHQLNYIA